MRPTPKPSRFKLKPLGLLDRLFSTLLIAFLLIGQPAAVVRVLAQEAPPAALPTPLAPEQTPRPFVGTDQGDYPPGATANILGRDFQPGETVWLQVTHADGTPDSGDDHEPWTVLAGADGAFQSAWHVCEDDCLGATLLLTASGQSSGLVAQMQFTDGTPSGTSPVPGSLYAMGENGNGQLGTGDNLNRATPTPVVSLPGGRKVIAVAGGEYHSLAQANDGSLWAWGYGGHGQIGNNTYSTTYVPVPVNALPGGRTAVSIAAGAIHNLVLANDGSLWSWGYGYNGVLGFGGSGYYPYPVQVATLPGGRTAVQIAAGGYHNLALANDGSLWAWGYGYYGQLGYGGSGDAYFPVPIVPLPGGRIVAAIAAGYYHSLALATDGTIWAWGNGGNGQLGNGGSGNAYTRVAVNPLPGGRVPVAIAAGVYHSLALASDGTIWAWGTGYNGELGNGYGSPGVAYSPVAVNPLPSGRIVQTIATAGYHNYALATDGSMWAWGRGGSGQLGNGSTVNAYSPVAVNSLPAGKSILRIAGGAYVHGFILASDVNQAPVAANDNVTVNEDTILSVAAPGVLGNDTDANSQPLNTSVSIAPANAAAFALNADGSFTYTPNASFHGTDSFTYRAFDGTDYSLPATVTITVTPVNDTPVANAQSVTTSEDTAANVTLTGSDVDGDALTFSVVSGPAHGTLSGTAPNLTYTPAANYNGPDGFSFLANDGTVASAPATVSLNVTPVNDGPVANTQSVTTPEDTPVAITLTGSDAENGLMSFAIVNNPAHGSLSGSAPNVIYSPALNYHGPDSFTFLLSDGELASAVVTVSITVNPVNDAPVAVSDSYNLGEDMILSLASAANGVLANDSDVDGNPLTALLVSGPSHGSLTLNPDGRFTYTPVANFNGPDTFTYKASDGTTDSGVASVTINVIPVNDAPVALSDSYNLGEDMILSPAFAANGVLANDSDVDGNPLTALLVSGPSHGSLTLNPDGRFTYTPVANFNGPDTFTYKANDGTADSGVASVTINVIPVNDAPVANAQSVTTPEDSAASITLTGSDVDGDTLSFSVVTPPAHGALSGVAPNLVYTPAANYNGPDSFTFKANDGALDSTPTTVSITVTPVNDGPQLANPGNKLVNELEPLAFTLSATDVDLPTDTLTCSIANGGASGMTLDAGTGAFSWTPSEAQGPGTYTVTFRATDSAGVFSEQTITITVSEVNIVPTITDVPTEAIIPELASFTFDASGSDADAPVQTLTFSLIGTPTGATIDATTGVFNWTPAEDQGAGDYTFAVRISDGVTTADSPIVLHVTEVNVTPVADAQSVTTPEDTGLLITLTGSDVDLPANTLAYSVSTGPLHGSLSGTAPNLTYTPAENYNGPDSFTFKANDGTVDSGVATVTINVTPVNDAPLARCKNVTVSAGANCTADASIDDDSFDPDTGDTITLTQTPAGPYPLGDTTVTLTVTDNHSVSSTCTAMVTVQDVTPPVTTVLATVTGQCSATVTAPTANDNCAGTVTGTTSDPLVYNTQGTFTVHWTFSDGHGNSSTANQTVIVQDTEKPTLTCPADLLVVSDRSACAAGDHDDHDWEHHSREGRHRDEGEDHSHCGENRGHDDNDAHGYTCKYWNRCLATGVVLIQPVVADNCAVASVVNDHPSTTYPLGVTLVTWTVTDTSGNSITCVQKVTVVASVEVSFRSPLVRKPTGNTIRRGQVVPFKVELENCLDQTVRSGVTVKFQVQGIDASTGAVFQDVIEDANGLGTDGTVTSDGLMQYRNSQWQFNLDTSNFGDANTIAGNRYYRAHLDSTTVNLVEMGA